MATFPPPPGPARSFAGFWLRFVAYTIDSFVVGIPIWIIFALLMAAAAGISSSGYRSGPSPAFILLVLFLVLASIIGPWLYWALFESSAKQATLGKMAAGIEVTDLEGKKISFGKASGRYWGKIISSLILNIGFMMTGWTQKKQALHDIMAGTLVVRKR
jgi:uncharacterized RDD family membrane protein YckC